MFEKEAEEYAKPFYDMTRYDYVAERTHVKKAFQEGAEFAYNKANEWHYMKDVDCFEDLPQNKDVYYAYLVNVGTHDEPTIERRLGSFAEFKYDFMDYQVIAWKEIVLPELKESE
ncbi:MAG: hypothetical protein J5930_09345 [Treponema sp.]|nr:hypothetical protein [Treponema sp.]MBO5608084.1 hypothetical protein [Treponema sp.]